MRDKFIQTVLGLVLLSAASASLAVPITGEIGISADGPIPHFTPIDAGGATVDLSIATGIRFNPSTDNFVVDTATGTFASVLGNTGTIQEFQFAPQPISPVSDFWVVNPFSFDLLTIDFIYQDSNFIELSGAGLISTGGFDDTVGTWSFTGNALGVFITWSGGTAAVPEPGVLGLLGIGVFLIGIFGRSRKNGLK